MTEEDQNLMFHSLAGVQKNCRALCVVFIVAWLAGSPRWAVVTAVILTSVGVHLSHGLTPKA